MASDVDRLAKDEISAIEQALAESEQRTPEQVAAWLSILKQVITAADLHRQSDANHGRATNSDLGGAAGGSNKTDTGESIYADYADDNEQFHAGSNLSEQFASNSVKWTIRVQAFKLVHRLVQIYCDAPSKSNAPSSTVAPSSGHHGNSKVLFIKHLPDLVRLSFVSATSPYDDLKLQGFEMFGYLIEKFGRVEEKELPGHYIVEQYRTQVISALTPAFEPDSPPYITAIASRLCCQWICKGLERDNENLRRTFDKLVVTIEKLENQSVNQNSKLYTETELEQERLSILEAWAQLYIVSAGEQQANRSNLSERLNELIRPHVHRLIDKWWEALKDYSLLIMPSPKTIRSSRDDAGQIYTKDVALRQFAPVWPKLALASTIWLCDVNISAPASNDSKDDSSQLVVAISEKQNLLDKAKYFRFLNGILMWELCRQASRISSTEVAPLPESSLYAVRALIFLINCKELRSLFVINLVVARELYTVLYRMLVHRTKAKTIQYNLVRTLLDKLFALIVRRVAARKECVKIGMKFINERIQEDLSKLERAALDKADLQFHETLWTNLIMRINNTIAVIKWESELITSDEQLWPATILALQSVVSNQTEPTLGIILLDSIRTLLPLLEASAASRLTRDLFAAKLTALKSMLSSKPAALARDTNVIKSLAHQDAYLKTIKTDIDLAMEEEVRAELITSYCDLLLASCSALGAGNDPTSGKKRDLLIKHARELHNAHSILLKSFLSPEKLTSLDELLRDDAAQKERARQNANNESQKQTTSNTSNRKPKSKIVLKSDFSNFYKN